jgi:hypothetical protein
VVNEANPSTGEPEALPAGEPEPVQAAAPAPVPARKRGRFRRLLLVVAVIVGSSVVLGGAIGVVVYDKATAIDRSTPTVAVRQFLQAAVVDRDVSRIALFVCAQWSPTEALSAVGEKLDASVMVNWGVTSVQESGDQAQAQVRITFTAGGFSDVQVWRITVAREDGWRVCALQRN